MFWEVLSYASSLIQEGYEKDVFLDSKAGVKLYNIVGATLLFSSTTSLFSTDDYAKDDGPKEVWLWCSFYHESLRT